jgi:hypothetical protein
MFYTLLPSLKLRPGKPLDFAPFGPISGQVEPASAIGLFIL